MLAATLLAASACGRSPLYIPIPPLAQDFACPNPVESVSDDPVERGPWAVGARTIEIPNARWGSLTVEIWYPAVNDSEKGLAKKVYDLRKFLPDDYGVLIPDETGASQTCDCYDNLPIDTENGPYPVIVFIHGLASFRTQSSVHAIHWASRGFVVISADHPRIRLRDIFSRRLLGQQPTQSQDAVDIIAALHKPEGDLAFLAGAVDMARIGVSGHSAGASAAALLGNVPGVRAAVLMSSGGADANEYLQSVLIMGAENDSVIPYERQQSGYASTNTARRRLLGIANAGHMAFTEICTLLEDDGGLINVAVRYGVPVPDFIARLAVDGCDEDQTPPESGWMLINGASAAVFEEILQCRPDRKMFFEDIRTRFDLVFEFQEHLPE